MRLVRALFAFTYGRKALVGCKAVLTEMWNSGKTKEIGYLFCEFGRIALVSSSNSLTEMWNSEKKKKGPKWLVSKM